MNCMRSFITGIQERFSDPSVAEERRIKEASFDEIPFNSIRTVIRQKMKRNELHYELKAINRQQEANKIWADAKINENKKKNNSEKVLPYEFNRVELSYLPEIPHSNYINASWIDGFEKRNKYIVCQGPNVRTIGDFWRLVWEKNSCCIMMVTNLFEHSRQQCEKYWPKSIQEYDNVTVEIRNIFQTAEYTIRNFTLYSEEEMRDVRQIQFESWSDNDTPKIATVLEVRRQMVRWMKDKSGPIVIHCNNGAGRSGTFVCIDDILCKIEAQQDLDIANQVLKLRNARMHLVSTTDQYRFIHEVVSNYVLCGITVITREAARKAMCEKKSVVNLSGRAVCADVELRTIGIFLKKLSVGECAGGHRAENRSKSRHIMIQPPERARPYLTTAEGSDNSDYINAVYVDGYKAWNQYIVTQWPLRNSINDFWRLVYDHNASIIVLLECFGRKSKSCPVFWPSLKRTPASYGAIFVEILEAEDATKNVHCKLLKIYKNLSSKNKVPPKNVVVLQFLCWPPRLQLPESTQGFIELVELTDEWKVRLEPCGPIIAVSKDGISRCGALCVTLASLERLLCEGEFDIFRTVETVKRNRPQLVGTTAEYNYCYTCLQTIASRLPSSVSRIEPKPRSSSNHFFKPIENHFEPSNEPSPEPVEEIEDMTEDHFPPEDQNPSDIQPPLINGDLEVEVHASGYYQNHNNNGQQNLLPQQLAFSNSAYSSFPTIDQEQSLNMLNHTDHGYQQIYPQHPQSYPHLMRSSLDLQDYNGEAIQVIHKGHSPYEQYRLSSPGHDSISHINMVPKNVYNQSNQAINSYGQVYYQQKLQEQHNEKYNPIYQRRQENNGLQVAYYGNNRSSSNKNLAGSLPRRKEFPTVNSYDDSYYPQIFDSLGSRSGNSRKEKLQHQSMTSEDSAPPGIYTIPMKYMTHSEHSRQYLDSSKAPLLPAFSTNSNNSASVVRKSRRLHRSRERMYRYPSEERFEKIHSHRDRTNLHNDSCM